MYFFLLKTHQNVKKHYQVLGICAHVDIVEEGVTQKGPPSIVIATCDLRFQQTNKCMLLLHFIILWDPYLNSSVKRSQIWASGRFPPKTATHCHSLRHARGVLTASLMTIIIFIIIVNTITIAIHTTETFKVPLKGIREQKLLAIFFQTFFLLL